MLYSPPVLFHVLAGAAGILSGFAALGVGKGGPSHQVAGRVFVAAMLAMAVSATLIALTKSQLVNTLAGLFTIYLVLTAWATVARPFGPSGAPERALALLGATVAGLGAAFAVLVPRGLLQDGDAVSVGPTLYLIFGGLAAMATGFDLRRLRAPAAGPSRLARHLWRMCAALFIATASFFLGQADELPQAWRGPHLYLPPLLPLAALVFWQLKVRRPSRRRRASLSPPAPAG
jgi:uncharacterized membrane protein